jgi:hypothetical protein
MISIEDADFQIALGILAQAPGIPADHRINEGNESDNGINDESDGDCEDVQVVDKTQKSRTSSKMSNRKRRKQEHVRDAENAAKRAKFARQKKEKPGIFTNWVKVKDPDVVLDPLDPKLMEKIQEHVKFGVGYTVVDITKEGEAFLKRPDVQAKIYSTLNDTVTANKMYYDDDRRIEFLEDNWVEIMCPFLCTLIDLGGKYAREVSLMKVEQTARMQALHMDSEPLRTQIWRDNRTGFTVDELKDEYDLCPVEIIVALTDDCITRVIPNSQWVGMMSDEEYANFQPAISLPIKLKKGQALIFHPNLVHSGCMALESDFECKVHAKILAGKGNKWIPFKWKKNETYFIDSYLPKERLDAFARWKQHVPFRDYVERKAFEHWRTTASYRKWETEVLPTLLAARGSMDT